MDSEDYREFVNEIIKAKKKGELTTKESRELLDQVMKESGNPTAPVHHSPFPKEATYNQDTGAKG